jgi:hypothetical protein
MPEGIMDNKGNMLEFTKSLTKNVRLQLFLCSTYLTSAFLTTTELNYFKKFLRCFVNSILDPTQAMHHSGAPHQGRLLALPKTLD